MVAIEVERLPGQRSAPLDDHRRAIRQAIHKKTIGSPIAAKTFSLSTYTQHVDSLNSRYDSLMKLAVALNRDDLALVSDVAEIGGIAVPLMADDLARLCPPLMMPLMVKVKVACNTRHARQYLSALLEAKQDLDCIFQRLRTIIVRVQCEKLDHFQPHYSDIAFIVCCHTWEKNDRVWEHRRLDEQMVQGTVQHSYPSCSC